MARIREWALAAALLVVAGCGGSDDDPGASGLETVAALAREGDAKALSRAERLAAEEDLAAARAAVRAIGRMRTPAANRVLLNLATEAPRAELREEAVHQVGYRREAGAAPDLRDLLRRDRDPRVRAAAATALGRLRDLDGVGALVEAIERDEDPVVRGRAAGAVEQISSMRFGYAPTALPAERADALDRIRRWADGSLFTKRRGLDRPGDDPEPEEAAGTGG